MPPKSAREADHTGVGIPPPRTVADGVASLHGSEPMDPKGLRGAPPVASSLSSKRQRQILSVLLGAFAVLAAVSVADRKSVV